MIRIINKLPTPLKIVAWLNIGLGALSLIQTLAQFQSTTASVAISNLLSVALQAFVVIGIIQRSKLIRIIVLILSWLSAILVGLGFIASLATIGLPALVILIPLSIYSTTIWGLSTKESKAYFQNEEYIAPKKKEKAVVVRKDISELIHSGMKIEDAKQALRPFFQLEDQQGISDKEMGLCDMLLYCDKSDSSQLFRVYVSEGTIKAFN